MPMCAPASKSGHPSAFNMRPKVMPGSSIESRSTTNFAARFLNCHVSQGWLLFFGSAASFFLNRRAMECFCAVTSKPTPYVRVRLFYVDGSEDEGCWTGEEWEHEREEVHPV